LLKHKRANGKKERMLALGSIVLVAESKGKVKVDVDE
jgi:hypothetical protein